MKTFVPPKAPRVGDGASKQVEARIRRAQFGDGYSQRSGDGLNALAATVPLRWGALSVAQADVIEAFFEARRGYEAFLYTLPASLLGERKWIVTSWSRTADLDDVHSITATFEQVFDL